MSGFLLIDGDWGGRGLTGIWFVDVCVVGLHIPYGEMGFLSVFQQMLKPYGLLFWGCGFLGCGMTKKRGMRKIEEWPKRG